MKTFTNLQTDKNDKHGVHGRGQFLQKDPPPTVVQVF